MAAVLVEVGFVSHPEESRLLASAAYQERIAAAIAEGVAGFRAGGRRAAR
jgi:N-acetylmuramoyl-L-alanine amidase